MKRQMNIAGVAVLLLGAAKLDEVSKNCFA